MRNITLRLTDNQYAALLAQLNASEESPAVAPKTRAPRKAVAAEEEEAAPVTVKNAKPSNLKKGLKVRPMDAEFVGQNIRTLDGQKGTVVGMDEDRRMYKVRVNLGKGRPRLVPEHLIEYANFKKAGRVLVERTMQQIAEAA
jgi:hypothetical protein